MSTTVADTQAEQTRAAWDRIADGYDRFVTPTNDWALPKQALRLAGLKAGMRFLDVASGSGALSIPAARMGADVMAVDLSPQMIRFLRERASKEGLQTVQARVMDGHALELEDNTFDVAGSQFGVMLFPDLPAALREMVRVTKAGGKVFMVAFQKPSEVEFLTFFMGAMQSVVPGFTGLPTDPPPLPFQVADPRILKQKMEDAGLKDIRIEPSAEQLTFRSGKDMWDWVVNSNPIAGMLIGDLTADQKDDVRRVLDGMLRERAGGNGPAVLNAAVNIGIGTR